MLKRISAKDVQLGMFINELCGSWIEHPFWRTQFLLTSTKDLKTLQTSGVEEVWIDIAKGGDIAADAATKTDSEVAQESETPLQKANTALKTEQGNLEEEIRHAAKLCNKAKQAVMDMFNDARMGKAVETEEAQELMEEISNSALRHPHALISLARLKTADEYTFLHSVAVCALMIGLARQLGFTEDKVREAGLAGLVHDIGKIAIPLEILNKPGKLTDTEFTLIKSHPKNGTNILRKSHAISESVLDVCLHHHEKMDGSGYPHGLHGNEISLLARMGAVCDVYDAITSNRPYKNGWSPAESIRKMAEWKRHFDETVFQAFVKTVGIYPTGSLVRLESGRLGVVIEQHKTSLLLPKVKVFFSIKTKTPIAQEIIDLSKTTNREKITGREQPDNWGFKNLDYLWSGI